VIQGKSIFLQFLPASSRTDRIKRHAMPPGEHHSEVLKKLLLLAESFDLSLNLVGIKENGKAWPN
jgi:hypothetical protein